MSKEHIRVGTFCEKCRQVMCICQRQTAPKEIWIEYGCLNEPMDEKDLYSLVIEVHRMKCNDDDIKYLSETHVKELLSDKDKEINDLLKIVSERNAEIADINRYLDDNGYPSQDRYGNTYSIIERIENN